MSIVIGSGVHKKRFRMSNAVGPHRTAACARGEVEQGSQILNLITTPMSMSASTVPGRVRQSGQRFGFGSVLVTSCVAGFDSRCNEAGPKTGFLELTESDDGSRSPCRPAWEPTSETDCAEELPLLRSRRHRHSD